MVQKDIPRSSITVNNPLEVCINFDDASFAEAEAIFYDYKGKSLHAHIGVDMICLGYLPEDIARKFSSHMRLYLTARHPEGHMIVMDTMVQTLH